MDRRAFLGTLAGGFLASPLAGEARQAGKVPRIALVLANTPATAMAGPHPTEPIARAFLEAMRELGWVDGQNITIERKSAEGRPDRYPGLVQEVTSLKPTLMVVSGGVLLRAMAQGTTTLPIVSAGAFGDPVAGGYARGLDRPGGNVTGLTYLASNLDGKRLELLKEIAPGISRVAFLTTYNVATPETLAAARALKLDLLPVVVKTPEGLTAGFSTIERARVHALFLADPTFMWAHRDVIVGFAAKQRLPASYPFDRFAEAGGLMSYGINYVDIFRRTAIYADRILKGTNPADLPIEQPTKFDLVINLKTAKALGLTIPPSLLQRADR
jgi:putative ABC transport system substrate-binding protein